MDFASLMRTEIKKKAATLESKNIVNEKKRSFKRSELYSKGFNGQEFAVNHSEKRRHKDSSNMVYQIEKDYVPEKVNVADDDIAKAILETDNKVKNYVEGKDVTERKKRKKNVEEKILPPKIVAKRLRERREPIKLFGETDEDTYWG